MVRVGFIKIMIFKERFVGGERDNYVDSWGKSILGLENRGIDLEVC